MNLCVFTEFFELGILSILIFFLVFIDASDSCNTMSFHIGSESGTATREWAIRITQYVCDSLNLAPDGCLQYYYGSTTGMIQTFNYEGGMHLANQNQNICIRREKNQCRICYSSGPTDFAVSGTKLASTVASMAMAAVGKSVSQYNYLEGFGIKLY